VKWVADLDALRKSEEKREMEVNDPEAYNRKIKNGAAEAEQVGDPEG